MIALPYDYFLIVWFILAAGCTYVPLNPRFPSVRSAAMLRDSGSWDRDFAFTKSVGEAFLDIQPQIIRRRMPEKS